MNIVDFSLWTYSSQILLRHWNLMLWFLRRLLMYAKVLIYFSFFIISFSGFTLHLPEKVLTVSQPVYACKPSNALETNCISLSTCLIWRASFTFKIGMIRVVDASTNEQVGIDLVQSRNSSQENICVWYIYENVSDFGISYLFSKQEHAGICLFMVVW